MQDKNRKYNKIEKPGKESCYIDKYEVHHTSLGFLNLSSPN